MNHTRFPKKDPLPDWARWDIKVTKGDRVDPSVMCFRRQFQCTVCPIHLTFLRINVCRIYPSSLSFYNTSSFLTRSLQLITILLHHHINNFPGITDLLLEVSKVHHHTKQRSKCSVLLVPSINDIQFARGRRLFVLFRVSCAAAVLNFISRAFRYCPVIRPKDAKKA